MESAMPTPAALPAGHRGQRRAGPCGAWTCALLPTRALRAPAPGARVPRNRLTFRPKKHARYSGPSLPQARTLLLPRGLGTWALPQSWGGGAGLFLNKVTAQSWGFFKIKKKESYSVLHLFTI
ncbi:hypothetical protein HJG60_007929 [Phyllostomus discolor]|uniref:Uncharacterized protein n=1 Tax=Phyllostomus discolor TaxID=89673 RepID=A0A834BIM6_9CHIR|nr:hypothetical protein HJG60_007929 [Phyllostomus discolor]